MDASTRPHSREHLVVVLPGIGGSRLAVPGRPDQIVWDAGYGDVWNLLRHPERLSLDAHPRLEPRGLISSKALFGVWAKIEGYGGLLARLGAPDGVVVDDGTGPEMNLGAHVVAVGYDFRLGVARAAEQLDSQVTPRLRALWPNPDHRRGRIIFVAHSMGGLVARYWLAQQDNARLCRELITLGTPHRGAPKALDILANGVGVGAIHLVKGRVRELLRTWQGVYDLLPTEREVEDLTGDADKKKKKKKKLLGFTADGREREVEDLTAGADPLWRDAFSLPLAWNHDMADRARRLHAEIAAGWNRFTADVRPSVQPRIGFGHDTPQSCSWDGRRVRVTKEDSRRRGLGRWATDLGDGTVPVRSGLPPEIRDVPTGLWAALRHGQIVNLPEAVKRTNDAEEYPAGWVTEGDQLELVLGVGLDEVALAGVATPVSADVRGLEPFDGEGCCVATAISDQTPRSPLATRLEWDGATRRFVGALPPLAAGGYTVCVDWADGDALTTETSLEIVPDTLEGLDAR